MCAAGPGPHSHWRYHSLRQHHSGIRLAARRAMKYRKLGKTGLEVSALAFGGSSLGGVFRDVDEAKAIRAVHVALENGINLIDTAPYYGNTKAEAVLGRALRAVSRESYLLA